MQSTLRILLALAVIAAVATFAVLRGCPGEGSAPTASEVPEAPAEALAWVREAADQDEDGGELDRRLAKYPVDEPAFAEADETQVVLTWRMQRALAYGRLADAAEARAGLVAAFDGEARTPTGHRLGADAVDAGLRAAALGLARTRMAGPAPDLAAAREALAVAALGDAEDPAVARTRRWVALEDLGGLPLSDHDGPRVVALVDDFALGEVILPQVLGRWQRDLGPMGLRVSIVPLLRGSVRVGIRRLAAQDEKAELDAIRNRMIAYRVKFEPHAAGERVDAIGLEEDACAVFVLDRKGRIVARMSGPTIDPRRLETVVQRVASR